MSSPLSCASSLGKLSAGIGKASCNWAGLNRLRKQGLLARTTITESLSHHNDTTCMQFDDANRSSSKGRVQTGDQEHLVLCRLPLSNVSAKQKQHGSCVEVALVQSRSRLQAALVLCWSSASAVWEQSYPCQWVPAEFPGFGAFQHRTSFMVL